MLILHLNNALIFFFPFKFSSYNKFKEPTRFQRYFGMGLKFFNNKRINKNLHNFFFKIKNSSPENLNGQVLNYFFNVIAFKIIDSH